jgi:hypothetical protein
MDSFTNDALWKALGRRASWSLVGKVTKEWREEGLVQVVSPKRARPFVMAWVES